MICQILEKKRPIYFISPHVDDALLSSGALIDSLSKKTTVHIVTVFCLCKEEKKDTLPYILKAKRSIFERIEIEKKLLSGKNVVLHYLDYPDLLIRSKSRLYYKNLPHVMTLSEYGLKRKIEEQIKMNIPNNAIIFCPLAIGGHLDHLVVRKACLDVFGNKNIYFWKDYPYSLLFDSYKDPFVDNEFYRNTQKYVYSANLIRKGIIIHDFKRHLKEFFSTGISYLPIFPETYFYNKKHSGK